MQSSLITTSRRLLLLVALAVGLLLQGGCAEFKEQFNITSIDEDGNEISNESLVQPAKKLLAQGMEDYSVGKYFTAVEFFEEILNRYPFSPEAILAELKAADSSYHLEKYLEAIVLYEEFENRHPTNESIPYVIYQLGMSNLKKVDRVDRDPSGARDAITQFERLLRSYPDSPYTEEAKARIAMATEFLANHEFFVAKYYVRTAKFDQAAIRLNYLLATYPDSEIAPKAEKLLAEVDSDEPPRAKLWSWFPKITLPGAKVKTDIPDEEDTAAGPVER